MARLPTRRPNQTSAGVLLALSYAGFISLGLPDAVLGAAWPALRADLGLAVDSAGPLVVVTTAGVVASSVFSAAMRRYVGTAAILMMSTTMASVALGLNAVAHGYAQLLLASLVAGLGGGAIDTCINDFVARRYSARHMNWLHAFYGVGAMSGPIVVSSAFALGATWRNAYLLLAVVELALVTSFWWTRASWELPHDRDSAGAGPRDGSSLRVDVRSAVLASVLLFFFYGGVEAGVGLWAATLLTETRGATRALAGSGVAVYWGALTLGRVIFGALADALRPDRVVRQAQWSAMLACAALAVPGTPPWFVFLALAWIGASLAPIFPWTMHETPRQFGSALGSRLVGYQVAATSLGVATLPWLVGAIAARTTLLALPYLLLGFAVLLVGLGKLRRTTRPRSG